MDIHTMAEQNQKWHLLQKKLKWLNFYSAFMSCQGKVLTVIKNLPYSPSLAIKLYMSAASWSWVSGRGDVSLKKREVKANSIWELISMNSESKTWWNSHRLNVHPHATEQLRLFTPTIWACALVPMSCNCWSPHTLEPVLSNRRSHCNEKPSHHNQRA